MTQKVHLVAWRLSFPSCVVCIKICRWRWWRYCTGS